MFDHPAHQPVVFEPEHRKGRAMTFRKLLEAAQIQTQSIKEYSLEFMHMYGSHAVSAALFYLRHSLYENDVKHAVHWLCVAFMLAGDVSEIKSSDGGCRKSPPGTARCKD